MKRIAILGSTGSIGTQTLEVVRNNGDIEVLGISAGSNIKKLEEQAREFHPRLIAVWDEERARELQNKVTCPAARVNYVFCGDVFFGKEIADKAVHNLCRCVICPLLFPVLKTT